ncbi:GspE/PulE family protein [Chloroflexota bacterium]
MAKQAAANKEQIKKLSRKQLGELLIEQGLISPKELTDALEVQSKQGGRLGDILVKQGFIDYDVLLDILSVQLNVPVLDISGRKIPHEAQKLIPETMAREHYLIPLEVVEGRLLVVMAYPDDIEVINDIKAMTALKVSIGISSPDDIERAINLNYRSSEELEKQIDQFDRFEDKKQDESATEISSTPATQSLMMIIKQAINDRASDIHFEPQEQVMRVRFRIDGILHDAFSLPLSAHLPLLSRLKILGDMNIAEQRRPQDGQFPIKLSGKNVDIRVATVGSLYGERATLRILDKSLTLFTLEQLGFLPESLEKLHDMLKSSYGLILVGGPTGSGKTTSLYAVINHLKHEESNIMTIEDPIEYRFAGISQIQINTRAGISFSGGLKAIVRQDPDVILVGEIRDQETAQMAVQAALTGHLVLASIHANNAVSMLFRLIDLGIEPYLIASTLIGMISQRMIRRVCSYCAVAKQTSVEEQVTYYDYMKEDFPVQYVGNGCALCANTGYFGRTGIFELLSMNDEISVKLSTDLNHKELNELAIQQGMITMANDGMIKAKKGVTSLTEVLRCINTIR